MATPRPDVPTEGRRRSRFVGVLVGGWKLIALCVGSVASIVVTGWKLIPVESQNDALHSIAALRPAGFLSAVGFAKPTCPEGQDVTRWPELSHIDKTLSSCSYGEALRELEAAAPTLKDRKDEEGRARAQISIAEIDARSTYYISADLTDLMRISRDSGLCPETRLKGQVRLGEVYERRRQYQKAEDEYRLVASDPDRSSHLEAQARAGLASLAVVKRDYTRAEENLKKSLQALQSHDDVRVRAHVHTLQGEIEQERRRFDRAYGEYRRAADLLESLRCGEPRRTLLLSALGDLKRDQGVGEMNASDLYDQAYQMAKDVPFAEGRARARVGVALLDASMKQFDAAVPKLEEALAIYRQAGDLAGEAYVRLAWKEMCHAGEDALCEQNQSAAFERLQAQLPLESRLRVP